MLSRALSLATVMLLASFAVGRVQAQNLEAGKTSSQIFSGSCAACHKSARGLLKTVTPGALPGFLRQHYTTSSGMASSLSAYLVSNGAADKRYDDGLRKQGQEAIAPRKPAGAPAAAAPQAESPSFFGFGRRAEPEPKPEPEAAPMTPRQKRAADRAAKRLARPEATAPDVASPASEAPAAELPAQKQKLGKKGRNREAAPKPDAARDEPAKPETAKPEMARPEPAKEDAAPEAPKPEAARPEPVRSEPPAVRADPVPAVMPAPAEPKAEQKSEPSEAKPASE